MRAVGILGYLVLPCALALGAPEALAGGGAEAGTIPVPHGTVMLGGPNLVDLGSQSLRVNTFASPMDAEELVAFYQEALPEFGWQVRPLPWQESHAKATRRLARAVRSPREDPKTRRQMDETLEEYRETETLLRQQLYASRGRDHLIVNLWSMDDQGTMVFINRWTGSRAWLEGGGPARVAQAGPSTLAAPGPVQPPGGNVCCTAEEVPALKGKTQLPFSVPRYPGAKVVAQGAPAGGDDITVVLMTRDGVEEIAAYYEERMPRNGWRRTDDEGALESSEGVGRVLRYEKFGRWCTLTIEGPGPDDAGGGRAETIVTVMVASRDLARGEDRD